MIKNYKLAESSDFESLNDLKNSYSYWLTLNEEITGAKAKNFHWYICQEGEKVLAFHRSILNSGWGFLGGIGTREDRSNIWVLNEILKYALDDLASIVSEGLIAWDYSATTHKAKLLKRLGFEATSSPVYRFIFDVNGIKRVLKLYNTNNYWRMAKKEDYNHILNLIKYNNSFINSLPMINDDINSNWLVKEGAGGINSAINWWVHGKTLEVHFSLSDDNNSDLTDGLIKLLNSTFVDKINYFKINLESSRSLMFLRLLACDPKTYTNGYSNICLIKKKG